LPLILNKDNLIKIQIRTKMKKIIMLMSAMMLVLASCSTKSDSYKISGKVEGAADGDTVILGQMGYGLVPMDTAFVKDGKFEFTGSHEGADLRMIMVLHNGLPIGGANIILENAPISVQIFNDIEKDAIVKGGPNGKLWKEFDSKMAEFEKKGEGFLATASDSTVTADVKTKAENQLMGLQDEMGEYVKSFILKHNPSGISDMLFGYYVNNFPEETVDEILADMEKKGSDLPYYKQIKKFVEESSNTRVGKDFTDITLPDVNGKDMKLSDVIKNNKYTLVDFWASWCGPCVAEMPNVVKAYEAYHSKGLEIVGVSLDEDADAWKSAISRLNMKWPQMSDLKGWESKGAGLYHIQSIPSNVLISQDGKIVAKGLMGDDLMEKLKELLK